MGVQTTALWAMQTNPKFIFFTDFDGTITLQDSESNLSLGEGSLPHFQRHECYPYNAGL